MRQIIHSKCLLGSISRIFPGPTKPGATRGFRSALSWSFSELDSANGIEEMNMLRELNKEGTTIVMVTHNMRDAEFTHRIINLFDGQILMEKVG